ncbi:MAG: RNA polymerase sigma factor [Capsulimonadaceae bacterium]
MGSTFWPLVGSGGVPAKGWCSADSSNNRRGSIIQRMADGQGERSDRTSDEALADRVRAAGDAAAFAELAARYRVRLIALARRMAAAGRDEAEDIVQDALLAAYRSRATYRRGEPFRPWLYRIAVNRCIDRHRAGQRRPSPAALDSVAEPVAAGDNDPLRAVLADERDVRVQSAVEALPPRYRAVFLLRHLDDLSYEEIATATELPVGTVKTQLFRARAQLREALHGLLEG